MNTKTICSPVVGRLTQANNVPQWFRTSWCDMLGGCTNEQTIIHFWYKFTWLQDHIEKLSTYLGKMRRTEEAQHLLDLIRMTKDEEDLFYPFARDAMACVFDDLAKFTPKIEKAYLWNEGATTLEIPTLPTISSYTFSYSPLSGENGASVAITPADSIDTDTFGVRAKFRFTYTIGFDVTLTGTHMTRTETIETDMVNLDYDGNSIFEAEVTAEPTLEEAGDNTSAEYVDSLDAVAVVEVETYYLSPDEVEAGDWVQYNSKLYKALVDTDTSHILDTDYFELQETDFRKSIHYIMHYPNNNNKNMIDPIDTAIFECLVNYILYKWLELSYPKEADVYLRHYVEEKDRLQSRLERYMNNRIQKIPRIL